MNDSAAQSQNAVVFSSDSAAVPPNLNQLDLTSILAQGFGTIPQSVMRDKRITPDAKLLYSYLSSFTGRGSCAYPSTPTILEELSWGKDKFYRARKELEEIGLVQLSIKAHKGGGRVSVYQLPSTLDLEATLSARGGKPQKKGAGRSKNFESGKIEPKTCYGDLAGVPDDMNGFPQTSIEPDKNVIPSSSEGASTSFPQEPKTCYGDFEKPVFHNSAKTPGQSRKTCYGDFGKFVINYLINNNKSISQSLSLDKKTNLKALHAALSLPMSASESEVMIAVTDRLTDDLKSWFCELVESHKNAYSLLCQLSLKPIRGIDVAADTQAAWFEALDAGYSPEGIIEAYRAYIVRYRADNPTNPRYAKQLRLYLREADGLAFDIPVKEEPATKEVAGQSTKTVPIAVINAYIVDDDVQFESWLKELGSLRDSLKSEKCAANPNSSKVSDLESQIAALQNKINSTREKWLNSARGKEFLATH